MKEQLEQNRDITANSKQIELLKKNFPQCFDKHGAFIADKMQELVGDGGINLSKESYNLNWLGKSYARLLANENARTLLHEDSEHNQKPENKNSKNLLIQGDNLEVLKHLVNAYTEKVRMIYIDPPYNTGKDGFVYQDDRKFTPEQLMKLAGVEMDDAKRILNFTHSKANSHSAWLTFMYPRLYIARELLKNDGVIFISIDDNEQAQLKLLCDEVFGEENFLEEFVWRSGRTSASIYTNEHEYILAYAKHAPLVKLISYDGAADSISDRAIKKIGVKNPASEITFKKGIRFEGQDRVFDNTLGDSEKIQVTRGVFESKNGELANEVTIKAGWVMKNMITSWLKGKEVFDTKGQKIEEFFFKSNGVLQYVKEKGTVHPKTIIENITTKQGSNEVESLLGKGIFDYPKPTNLIKYFATIAGKDSIILDFFSGTGTTANAVMSLNSIDGGNRRHISVQINEQIDKKDDAYKAGYKTIFDITKTRIQKAAEKIKKNNPEYLCDLGFKLFETVQVFDGYLDEMETLDPQQELFDGTTLSDSDLQNLLTTWKAYDGFEWTDEGEWVTLGNYSAYYIDDTLYCLRAGFKTDDLKALLLKVEEDKMFSPTKMILFGYNFDSKAQREIVEAMSHYKNKKAIEIDCEVRH